MGAEERETIALGVAREEGFAEIARRLGRPTSTISREVERNGGRDLYRASTAQRATGRRARRPKERKLVACPRLAGVVEAGLEQRWSPAEVAARLPVDHPDDSELRVSHETIYASLYLQGKGGLKKELISALRVRSAATPPPPARRESQAGQRSRGDHPDQRPTS